MKKLIALLLVGLLSVVAFADIQTGYDPDDDGDKLRFGDGNEAIFGGVTALMWEDADVNANAFTICLPAGGSVDVPAVIVGIGTDDVDLGLFDGKTAPGIYILDTDRDSYIGLTWVGDDSPEIEVGGEATTCTIPGITGYTLGDDTDFGIGGSAPMNLEYTTADANANCLIFDLPTGGATDVPVVCLVQTDSDLGYFNGVTQTTFALEDTDGDSYLALTFSADDVALIDGGGSTSAIGFIDNLTFGVNDTGIDVTFYGATAGDSILFDESADELVVEDITVNIMDDTILSFGDGDDATIQYDENGNDDLQITGTVGFDGNVNFGIDDTGVDVTLYGATSGVEIIWDESADELEVDATIDMDNQLGLKVTATSDTWDPSSIDDGNEEAKEVTVTGAALGDFVLVSFSLDVADLVLDAQVTAADTVTCILANNTGGAIDLGSGTVYVHVIQNDL